MEERERNVFLWLDEIRNRPGMYIRSSSLDELESLVGGYYAALWVHGILENVPTMNRHFLTWLYCRTKWSCECGWAAAIGKRYSDRDKALKKFFTFTDEYRQLLPTILWTVKLGAKHKPTGKRVRYGLNGLMEKPVRVDVICYRPGRFHFLRFHFRDRVQNGEILMTRMGEYNTTVRFAKEWVREELQVELAAWERVRGHALRT